MKTPDIPAKRIPAIFAILTIVAYGLLLPYTGFYWDDWPFAWIARFQGPTAFFRAFEGVRPFLGPIFFVTTSLIPPIPIYWQIFALVIRFVSGLSAWFALSQTWPWHKRQAMIASLLFLLFPGYSQHWVAFTHINQEWIPLILYLLSFGLTARALRNGDQFRPYTIYALLLLLAGVFPTEYFIGLEPLRFIFIWVSVAEGAGTLRHRFVQTLKLWLPYLLIWLGNIVWLAYFYTVGTYDSYSVEVVKSPLTVLQILSTVADTIGKAGFQIWGQILVLASESLGTPASTATLVLITVIFVAFLFYIAKSDGLEGDVMPFAVPAVLAGIVGLLLGRLPSFAAGLPLTLQSSNDRFMISMMLGSSLFVVGLIEFMIGDRRAKNYVFSFLIALAVGQQFFNANIFRRDWAKQQEIFQQLAWRIPAMKPNTTLLTDVLPVDYETDLAFIAPLNWMYAPDYSGGNLPYGMLFTEIRLEGPTLPVLAKDRNIDMGMRTAYFHGSTSQAIVIYMPQNGCLRVLDPARGDQLTYAQLPYHLVEAIPLSNPSNILLDHPETPGLPFLAEPKHSWCYFYAQAELAYQRQEWYQVVDRVDEAMSLGYSPGDPFEWLGYIEAQARIGNDYKARETSMAALESDKSIRRGLCEVWKRVQAEGHARGGQGPGVDRMLVDLQCTR